MEEPTGISTEPTSPPLAEAPTREYPVTRIRPSRGWVRIDLHELWEYRELLYIFVWRDLKVRYKQTVIGAAWAIIQPLMTMVVFSIFFGKLAGLQSDGVPYPVFAYAALVPWTYFANAMTGATGAVVEHGRIISKVYFPRIFLPAGPVLAGVVDLAIAMVVVVVLMLVFGIVPTPAIVTLPLFLLLTMATAMAVGLWLSGLNAMYRDVRYAVPFLVQFWLFASPVAYSSSLVPESLRALYGINPLVGVIEGFRWALLGTERPDGMMMAVSCVVVAVLLVTGAAYFRRVERAFADVV